MEPKPAIVCVSALAPSPTAKPPWPLVCRTVSPDSAGSISVVDRGGGGTPDASATSMSPTAWRYCSPYDILDGFGAFGAAGFGVGDFMTTLRAECSRKITLSTKIEVSKILGTQSSRDKRTRPTGGAPGAPRWHGKSRNDGGLEPLRQSSIEAAGARRGRDGERLTCPASSLRVLLCSRAGASRVRVGHAEYGRHYVLSFGGS